MNCAVSPPYLLTNNAMRSYIKNTFSAYDKKLICVNYASLKNLNHKKKVTGSTMKNNTALKLESYIQPKSRRKLSLVTEPKRVYKNELTVDALIKEHGEFVLKFIRKRTWDEQSVEDIYQSTMLEALKCFSNFRGDSHPRTWLCGVAYNLIRNYSKNLKAPDMESIDEMRNADQLPESDRLGAENPLDIYSRNDLLDRINNAFNELPKEMQTTFNEVVNRGKSYEETAIALDVPIGTVRSRIARAREILKEKTRYNQ